MGVIPYAKITLHLGKEYGYKCQFHSKSPHQEQLSTNHLLHSAVTTAREWIILTTSRAFMLLQHIPDTPSHFDFL